jgi:hypothetical protein
VDGATGHLGAVERPVVKGVDRAALVAWVQASCQAQGVPEKVTDPAALRRIGDLLGAGAER